MPFIFVSDKYVPEYLNLHCNISIVGTWMEGTPINTVRLPGHVLVNPARQGDAPGSCFRDQGCSLLGIMPLARGLLP